MRKAILLTIFLSISFLGFAQGEGSIVMNDSLIQEYFIDYVSEASERGYDVEGELLEKIDFIIIVPDEVKVCELAQTDLKMKMISLDSKVMLDRLILKVNLYRELSYVLGVPYNKGSVIMDRQKDKGFSYAAFDDVEIMDIELSKLMEYIK